MFGSQLQFGILAYGCAPKSKLKKIVTLQKKCIRHVANVGYRAHADPIFHDLAILKFDDVFKYSILCFMHQFNTNRLPSSFNGMFTLIRETEERNVRDDFYNYEVSVPIKKSITHFPRVIFPPIWNSLNSQYQCTESHKVFKNDCKSFILSEYGEFSGCDDLSCPQCINY